MEKQIQENKFDVNLSRTCPYKHKPKEMFLASIVQNNVDISTEKWLDKIEEPIDYKA